MLEEISIHLANVNAPAYLLGDEADVTLNEALWAYLLPQIEQLATATGELIDIYGVAVFTGENLEILKEHTEKWLTQLRSEKAPVLLVFDEDEPSKPGTLKAIRYHLERKTACDDLEKILQWIAQATIQEKALQFKGR